MARGGAKLVIKKDTLGPGIKDFGPGVEDALVMTTDFFSPRVEGFARQNAPWTDRTGNARNGLNARSFHEGNTHGIRIAHSMPYGIWLEIRHEGRFANIEPTVKEMGKQYMDALRGLFSKVR